MDIKDKLLLLKEHILIPDAAKYLTAAFGYEVTKADIFRFALDGHLRMSVYCVNPVPAIGGKIIPITHADISVVKYDMWRSFSTVQKTNLKEKFPFDIVDQMLEPNSHLSFHIDCEVARSIHKDRELIFFEGS